MTPPRRPHCLAIVLVIGLSTIAACGSTSTRADGPAATGTGTASAGAADSSVPMTDPGPATGDAIDPGTLPQTHDRPTTTSPAFAAGSAALWQAVVADDPAPAMAFFFPLTAYRQVKAIADPSADWQHRLVAAFQRDIHQFHQRLGPDASRATFVGLSVPDQAPRWVNPGEEYNKLGYWRVYGSTLQYRLDGAVHEIGVYSLISWRGEWYVVHLTAP